jgi:LCP family protein required for cell wall assembly
MNQNTKEIKMVSVYRDTLLDNTNGEYHKATECYYYGGPSRSVNMLNKNLDLNLQNYITVDFNAVIKAVDLVGGVDVDVTEEELPYINGYQTENAQVTGAQITPVESAGYQHLNGIQALAYCRIRYTASLDMGRTERQRRVIQLVVQKLKKVGVSGILGIMDELLPLVSTSLNVTEILSMVPSLIGYSVDKTTGFPIDYKFSNFRGDVIVPDTLVDNVVKLHKFLYGKKNGYSPSVRVSEISDTILKIVGGETSLQEVQPEMAVRMTATVTTSQVMMLRMWWVAFIFPMD